MHVVNAEQEVFESLRSSLPDQYYDGRAPEQEGEQPQPQQQHRRQRSQRGQRQEQEHEQGGEEGAGEERGRSLSPPMEGWI